MPRKSDWRCRGCGDMLGLDDDRYCPLCSDPKTRKALSSVYRQMNERDEKKVNSPWPCRCRPPKRHVDCKHCGHTPGETICGICREQGRDGHIIRGTSRVVCKLHKQQRFIKLKIRRAK